MKPSRDMGWRAGGDKPHMRTLPGGTMYEAITLEQGLTHDPVFEAWVNKVNSYDENSAASLKDFRKDIVINVLNLQGQVAISYKVYRAWVSAYQALPDFDASSTNAVGIQSIKLEHEGWERDTAVSEPAES